MMNAHANVATTKASRYLKALCNHFNRKVVAGYNDNHGTVQFGFGYCEMTAEEDQLIIQIQADDEESFARVKYVVSDHLERFASDEGLQIIWQEMT